MKGNQKSTGSLSPSLVAAKAAIGSKYGIWGEKHNDPRFYKLHQPTKTTGAEGSAPVKTLRYLFSSKNRSNVDRPGKTNTRDLVNQPIPEAFPAKNPATGLYCTISSHEKQYPAHWRDCCNPS